MPQGRVPATGQIINSQGPLGMHHPDDVRSIKYTRRADQSGWLTVKLSKLGIMTSLCEYTQVNVLRSVNHRTYFKIMDGYISPGEEASLADTNAELYLAATGPVGATGSCW